MVMGAMVPCPEDCELARAYVPIQRYNKQYSPEDGLERGTIFPELYRPYPVCYDMEDCD